MLCFLISAVCLAGAANRTEANQVGAKRNGGRLPLSEHEPNAVSSRTYLLDWGLMRAVGMVCFVAALLTAGISWACRAWKRYWAQQHSRVGGNETATGLSDTVEVARRPIR